VRILGEGDTSVDDTMVGHADVWRDAGSLEVARGPGTRIHQREWVNPKPVEDAPWLEPRNWGSWRTVTPFVWVAPDIQLVVGGAVTRTTWGFRSRPYARQQTIGAAWSTGFKHGKLEYLGTFRRPGSSLAARLDIYGSQIDHPHFFGFGNETPEERDRHRYRSRQTSLRVRPTLFIERGARLRVSLGPTIEYSDLPLRLRAVRSCRAHGGPQLRQP
jgi:hypothetical protein